MKFSFSFTIMALLLIAVFIFVFYVDSQLPLYVAWLVSLSLTTLIFYWVDKRLSMIRRWEVRISERTLNLLTLAGGFPGAWIGRLLCRHKTNIKKHRGMFVIPLVSTLLHAGLTYAFFAFWADR